MGAKDKDIGLNPMDLGQTTWDTLYNKLLFIMYK